MKISSVPLTIYDVCRFPCGATFTTTTGKVCLHVFRAGSVDTHVMQLVCTYGIRVKNNGSSVTGSMIITITVDKRYYCKCRYMAIVLCMICKIKAETGEMYLSSQTVKRKEAVHKEKAK